MGLVLKIKSIINFFADFCLPAVHKRLCQAFPSYESALSKEIMYLFFSTWLESHYSIGRNSCVCGGNKCTVDHASTRG